MPVRRRVRGLTAIVVTGLCLVTALACGGPPPAGGGGGGSGGGSGPRPVVTPASGGGGVPVLAGFTSFDLADVGYERSEVVLSGTASSYVAAAPLGADGRYAAEPATTAPYATRAVVVKPERRSDFNGTVVVEWLNVSGGADAGPDWMLAHTELVREGYAWVGVSAQKAGVDALKGPDPQRGDAVRYAGLSHPGDSYSYDIYSQVGRAIRADRTVLGSFRPDHVIAVGESQSAFRLVTYIDAVHPLVDVYDGFLVHSRFDGGAPLSQAPQADVPVPTPAPIRDDIDVPVLTFQTETDVLNSLNATRRPDTDTYRLWEVAGTAHFDQYGLVHGWTDVGDGQGPIDDLAAMRNPTTEPNPILPPCSVPINTGPAHYVLNAAFHGLNRWVTRGVPPASAPRLEVADTTPATFVRDADGNALGGIRTPAIDAPVATLSGEAGAGAAFCFLFGTTVPFTPERLAELYPTHRSFVQAWRQAARSARDAGFLVRTDARQLVDAAAASDIGG